MKTNFKTIAIGILLMLMGAVHAQTYLTTTGTQSVTDSGSIISFFRNDKPVVSFIPVNGGAWYHIGHDLNDNLLISSGNVPGEVPLMIIKNVGGKVGIGTTSPSEKLDVSGNIHVPSGSSFLAGTNGGKRVRLYTDGYDGYINYSNYLYFTNANGQIKQTITNNGSVGIGTLTPVLTLGSSGDTVPSLDVNGQIHLPYDGSYWIGGYNDSGKRLRMHHNGVDAYIDYVPNLHFRGGVGGKDMTETMYLDSVGHVGIGTLNPKTKFEIYAEGDPTLIENDYRNGLQITGTDEAMYMGVNTTSHVSYIQSVDIGTTSSPLLLNARGGNVGIGVYNPQNALDVNGTIHAKEVLVDMNNWSDFVFEKNYQLPSIKEVHSYIQENGHLPNIPSEKEVKANGVNVTEMQAKLLQKIEELTLYVIHQDQKIDQLQKELDKYNK